MQPAMPMHFNALTSAGRGSNQDRSIGQSRAISSSWMRETALEIFRKRANLYRSWSCSFQMLSEFLYVFICFIISYMVIWVVWSHSYLSAIGYWGIVVILPLFSWSWPQKVEPRCVSNCGGLCRAAAVSSKFFTPQPSNPAMTGA